MLEPRLQARQLANRTVRVSVPADIGNDLAKFQRLQKDILGKLGCMACCSGWDIRWDTFTDFQVDKNFKISGQLGG
jgi:hypothetical protein